MIENCGQCHYLGGETQMGLTIYGCYHPSLTKKKRFVVPQNTHNCHITGDRTAKFHRVPLSCPRPDTEVHKQPESEGASGK